MTAHAKQLAPAHVAAHLDARYTALIARAEAATTEAGRLLGSAQYAAEAGLFHAAESVRVEVRAHLDDARDAMVEADRIRAARIAR